MSNDGDTDNLLWFPMCLQYTRFGLGADRHLIYESEGSFPFEFRYEHGGKCFSLPLPPLNIIMQAYILSIYLIYYSIYEGLCWGFAIAGGGMLCKEP